MQINYCIIIIAVLWFWFEYGCWVCYGAHVDNHSGSSPEVALLLDLLVSTKNRHNTGNPRFKVFPLLLGANLVPRNEVTSVHAQSHIKYDKSDWLRLRHSVRQTSQRSRFLVKGNEGSIWEREWVLTTSGDENA